MRTLASFAFVLILLPSVTTSAYAAFAEKLQAPLQSREQQILLRPCQSVDEKDRPRCEARQKRSAERRWGMSSPTKAFELYDQLDLGNNHLRNRLMKERVEEFTANVKATRKTYRQFTPTDDVNTKRRPYINDFRQQRLDCMLEPHGRPRHLCFDKLTGDARKIMKQEKASMKYPAP